ncbi:MAG: divalent metal cation transporter [Planctomycetota bacterium]|jgi:Mn2+/Fe2+ NRAMP family transporter
MSEAPAGGTGVERDRALIVEAKKKGGVATFLTYFKLSGPGWLQSAITLGGGSLAGSLYLGIYGGLDILWLQPFAMILGIIMLSAIGYVTLSTGKRPFRAINEHVNPVLGWGWIIATLLANCVWALPQFSLATGATQQNLLPGLLGSGALGKLVVCLFIVPICVGMVWSYGSGGRAAKAFGIILKIMVAVIVVSFFGVVIKMSSAGLLEWGRIFNGLIPRLGSLFEPGEAFEPLLSEVSPGFRGFWADQILGMRRSVMITAAATAVGINMTFLLPYSMLKRGWGKDFRGLATFDLATGLFVPFILATGCVVIAAATQFNAKPGAGLIDGKESPAKALLTQYNGLLDGRLKCELKGSYEALSTEERADRIAALPDADKRMAAVLVKRDVFSLAASLKPLTGATVSHYIFGIGVVGMAVSSIIILMLINGFVMCEILGGSPGSWTFRLGSLMPLVGVFGPFFWTQASAWLAVPTSTFGMVLLPIAYFTFALLMNQKSLLGDDMPKGRSRVTWNALMAFAAGLAGLASIWCVWAKAGWYGIAGVVAFTVAAVVVHFVRKAGPQVPAPGVPQKREVEKAG